jgi:hypothetical protein
MDKEARVTPGLLRFGPQVVAAGRRKIQMLTTAIQSASTMVQAQARGVSAR